MVGVPAQPVTYVTHSVGMRHGSHVAQGPAAARTVRVVGQQSVAQGTVTLETLMYRGQTWFVVGRGQVGVRQEAFNY